MVGRCTPEYLWNTSPHTSARTYTRVSCVFGPRARHVHAVLLARVKLNCDQNLKSLQIRLDKTHFFTKVLSLQRQWYSWKKIFISEVFRFVIRYFVLYNNVTLKIQQLNCFSTLISFN